MVYRGLLQGLADPGTCGMSRRGTLVYSGECTRARATSSYGVFTVIGGISIYFGTGGCDGDLTQLTEDLNQTGLRLKE